MSRAPRRLLSLLLLLTLAGCGQPTAQLPGTTGRPFLEALRTERPARLVIPSLGIDAPVETVGLDKDGNMDIPKGWFDVGWYGYGARPGERGNAVMAGHLDSTVGKAVFWDLHRLQEGDEVHVIDEDGIVRQFRVTKTEVYDAANAPLEEIFGEADTAKLNLITCNGKWDASKKLYDKRLAIFTEMVEGETVSQH